MATSSFTKMAACMAMGARTVRSLPPCTAAASVFWNSSDFAALRTSTFSPNPSLRIKYSPQIRALATGTASETKTRTISVGDKLPDSDLSFLDKDGNVQTVKISDLTKGKKVVIFAVPGAFTPTCSQKHVPGFIEKSGELKSKGVDVIACVSVNDVFVMRAWGEDLGVGDKVLLLSDGNGNFTNALGVSMDLSDKPQGLGVRSRRYSLLAEDGIVKILNLEEGGSFNSSSAEDLLKAL